MLLDPKIAPLDMVLVLAEIVTNAVGLDVSAIIRRDDREPVPGIYPLDDTAPARIKPDLQDGVPVPRNVDEQIVDQELEVGRLGDPVYCGLVVGEEPERARQVGD